MGAPRCGTSALVNLLGQHPDVFVPFVKEPHFFGSDLTTDRGFPTLETYLALYANAGRRGGVDASTWYLYSSRAAQEIAALVPDAHVVMMVRDPVELVYSWHGHAVLRGIEPLERFEDALAAESDRRDGHRVPEGAPIEKLLYRSIPRFGVQIERYLEVFGRDRVHIVVHDDFKADNRAEVAKVFAFIGLDAGFQPQPAVVNAEARPRSQFLQWLTEHQPHVVRRAVRSVMPHPVRHKLRNTLRDLNSVPRRRPPLDPAVERHLRQEFAPDVEWLAEMLGRDLGHWIDGNGARSHES